MRSVVVVALLALAPAGCGEAPGDSEGAPGPGAAGPEAAREAPAETGDVSRDAGERNGTRAVYVPAYSHIYHHVGDAFLLATTLSIRNTSPSDSISVTSVRYYDTRGELVRRTLAEPRTLEPLGSMEFVVEEQDVSGGSGANFIVEWRADGPVNPPIVEAVMISTRSGQGISFTSRGVPIEGPRK